VSNLDRLRIPFYVGAVVDAFAAIALVSPAGSPIRAAAYPGAIATQVEFADGTRAAFGLMVGWTFLLAWAARRPIERRTVLLLTAFPAVPGLMLGELLDVAGNHATSGGTVQTLVVQAVLVAIFVAGYIAAGRAERATPLAGTRPAV
jgi:hypothetical protein